MADEPQILRRILNADLVGFSASSCNSRTNEADNFSLDEIAFVSDTGIYNSEGIDRKVERVYFQYSDPNCRQVGKVEIHYYLSFDEFKKLGRPSKVQIDIRCSSVK